MSKLCYDDGLKYPYPQPIADRINNALSFGNTAIIELLPSGDKVKKSPHPHASTGERAWQCRQLKRELEVYQRLPPHHRLIRIYDSLEEDDGSLMLEYMPGGNLKEFLETKGIITKMQRLQWGIKAAEAIVLLHSYGVIYADIKPENMLLDGSLGLRIIDLAGASIDGKPPLSLESTRYFLPRSMEDEMPCDTITDLFALGSSIYQIMTGRPPYEYLDDREVEASYSQKQFPSVDGIPYGDIIRRCWTCEFESAQAVLDALRAELRHH